LNFFFYFFLDEKSSKKSRKFKAACPAMLSHARKIFLPPLSIRQKANGIGELQNKRLQ